MGLRYLLPVLFSLLIVPHAFAGGNYEKLERQLESRNPREREKAVRQLTSLVSEDRAFSLLKGAVEDPDTEVRTQTIFALGRSGRKEALPALITALKDRQLRVRKTAINSALDIGEGTAVKPVLRRWSRETDSATRIQILTLVLNSDQRRKAAAKEINLINTALADPVPGVRIQAISVLVSVSKTKVITSALSRRCRSEKDQAVLRHLVSRLAKVKDPSVLKLVESLVKKGNREIRKASFKTLESLAGVFPGETARVLTRFMSNPDEDVKKMAIHSARKCPSSSITKKLMRLAEQDASISIRIAAIDSLGILAESSSKVLGFLERFGQSPRAEIRYAAVQAVVGRSRNVRFFEKLILGDDPEIRAAAVQGLIQVQSRASGRVFVSILRNGSDPAIRIMAARALGHFGSDKSCRKALENAAKKDRNQMVRAEAKKVLDAL